MAFFQYFSFSISFEEGVALCIDIVKTLVIVNKKI
jgi:hypothetical protein